MTHGLDVGVRHLAAQRLDLGQVTLASVGVLQRIDDDHEFVAEAFRTLVGPCRQHVGGGHGRVTRGDLVAVNRRAEPCDARQIADEAFGVGIAQAARVGEPRAHRLDVVDAVVVCAARDRQGEGRAAFVRLADRGQRNEIRRFVERVQVAHEVVVAHGVGADGMADYISGVRDRRVERVAGVPRPVAGMRRRGHDRDKEAVTTSTSALHQRALGSRAALIRAVRSARCAMVIALPAQSAWSLISSRMATSSTRTSAGRSELAAGVWIALARRSM